MKFVDEFRDAELGRALAGEILSIVEPGRHYKVMEVCGGHTHSIYKYGLDDLLPANVELVHGPGCPVCVIPMGRVDDGIALAHQPGVIFTCFGDMMRVPGANGSLLDAKAAGADIRMVYSPLDALRIAKANPDREVVFFAIGFETTAPSTALTLKRAKAEGVANFSCMCNHVTIVPPLRALLDSPDLRLDGFVGPGHVSTVVGARPFEFIPADYGKPIVVSGFEPLDILQGVHMILTQIAEGRCEVENQYKRVVPYEGNQRALEVMAEVFELRPHFEWRGLGFISHSGLKLSEAYADLDAERRWTVPGVRVADPKACQCGEVLKGVIKPFECKVFGSACTPERPIGTCMVSSEGACAAYYNFGRFAQRAGGRVTDAVSEREQKVLKIIETARGKKAKFKDAAITMAHGAGGKATQTLIEGLFVPAFGSEAGATMADAGAVGEDLAMTTDSFVVSPLRFPGGSIGDLAVNGTVNDLAVSGARPLALTLAMILEEGLDSGHPARGGRRDRRRRARRRRRDRRRRHQGRRARPRRRDVPVHDRRRAPRPARDALAAEPAPRRPHPRLRLDRRARHRDHARARRVRAHVGHRVRHALAVARGRRPARRRRARAALHARRHARRRRLRAQRARARLGRGDDRARGGGAGAPGRRGRGGDPGDRPDVRGERGQARRLRGPRVRRRGAGRAALGRGLRAGGGDR